MRRYCSKWTRVFLPGISGISRIVSAATAGKLKETIFSGRWFSFVWCGKKDSVYISYPKLETDNPCSDVLVVVANGVVNDIDFADMIKVAVIAVTV